MSEVPDNIKKLASSRDFDVSVRIGKSGITPALIEEVKSQLNKKNLVKIKANKGLFEKGDMKDVWTYISSETSSTVVLARGNVAVLWK
ncbi:MAG: RNA-binding protein [Euryarchaeota archaeon]|nr:RNA-binding protein [Euryarchaeota archaeon]|tara:strand:- start:1375 stop:1638 length:264 start_codon:yes stop_codon:yes gene_type:complete